MGVLLEAEGAGGGGRPNAWASGTGRGGSGRTWSRTKRRASSRLARVTVKACPGCGLGQGADAARLRVVFQNLVGNALIADPVWTGVTFAIVLAGVPVYLVMFARKG